MNEEIITEKSFLQIKSIRTFSNAFTMMLKEGDVIIFPSFLRHRVNKSETDVPRITCSFNINTIKGSTRRVFSQ